MKIEYLHASKYGNGAKVAAAFKQQMAVKGVVATRILASAPRQGSAATTAVEAAA